MSIGVKRHGFSAEINLRPTWKPGLVLIAAIIKRAILDVVTPDTICREDRHHAQSWAQYQERLRISKARKRAWLDSGLRAEEFCKLRGITLNQLRCDCARIAHAVSRPRYRHYLDPSAWINSSSRLPWSFLWCLTQLFGEPDIIANRIRALISSRDENLESEKVA